MILAAAVCSAAAQAPKIGDIDFYGLRKLAPETILSALELKSGDPLPSSKGDLENRLELMPGVAAARVEAVCCDGPNAILFIGIEEPPSHCHKSKVCAGGCMIHISPKTRGYRALPNSPAM